MGYVEGSTRLSGKTRQSKRFLFQKGRLDGRSLDGMEGLTDPRWIHSSKLAVSLRLNTLPVALSFSSLSVPSFLPPLDFPFTVLPIPLLFFSLSTFLFNYSGLRLTFLGLSVSIPQNDPSFLTLAPASCRMWVVSHCGTTSSFWGLDRLNTPWDLAAFLL